MKSDHLHGIMEIKNIKPGVGATPRGCPDNESGSDGQPRGVAPITNLRWSRDFPRMKSDQKGPRRHSIRLKGYNYAQPGAYYVTICTQDRECLFGEIFDGEMILSDSGSMIRTVWGELSVYYPGIYPEMLQIMPNHLHGIIEIKNIEPCVGATPCGCPDNESGSDGQPRGLPLQSRFLMLFIGLKR